MGIICPRCHRELKEDVKFCNVCGISLDTQMPKLKIKWDESSQNNPQRLFSEYICKICGQPIKYIKQYNKWYCNNCNKYDIGGIKFPQQTTFYCTICSEVLTFEYQLNKWYCQNCRNYTLDLDQFHLESNEQIQETFFKCQYSTLKYSKQFLKFSSWQDIGKVMVTNKSIIFWGTKYWFKTNKIINIVGHYLNNISDSIQNISNDTDQSVIKWNCIKIEYQDSSGLIKAALLTAGGKNNWEVHYKTLQLYKFLYNWWLLNRKELEKQIKPPDELESQYKTGINVKSAINYEHAKIVYKVKIENNSSSSISDIHIKPYIPKDIFSIDQDEKVLSLIRKGEAKTSTFTIRPKGECGNVDISGNVRYFDTKTDEYNDIKIQPKPTKIICPMLKTISINEEDWRNAISRLISVKETTNDIPLSAEELFDMVSDVIKDMNMFMLKPKISKTRYVGKFYSEGIKGLKYAIQIEVIGGLSNSKLILNAFAENQGCLIGCYHKVLDEIEDRTDIKQYIKDPLIIKGDYIAGGGKVEVRDSVVHRTRIGSDAKGEKDSDVDWE